MSLCVCVLLYCLIETLTHILSSLLISCSSAQLMLQSWGGDEGMSFSLSLTAQVRSGLIDRQASTLIKVQGPGQLLPGVSDLS